MPSNATLEKPFTWLRSTAQYRVVWLGLPLLLYLWTLPGPFLFDDLTLLHKADQYAQGDTSSPGLFRFATNDDQWREFLDRGTVPWWSAKRHVDFFRPLAEWAFYLDLKLFGHNPLGHRAVSLLWFALALLSVRRLFASLSEDPGRAGVATLLFGLSQTVTQPATFICNRSDLFVVIGTTLAAHAYVRAGSRNHQPSPNGSLILILVATASFAFALLSKEIAVAFAGVLVAHTILSRLWKTIVCPTRTQITITAISFAMATFYLGYYYTTRIGPHVGESSGLGNLVSITDIPRIIATYLAVWMFGFPINLLSQAPREFAIGLAFAAAVAALIVLLYVRRSKGKDQGVLFFALWAGLFILPPIFAVPETRALCLATIGWAYLLAGLLAPAPQSNTGTVRIAPLWIRHWLFATNTSISLACAIGTILISNHLEYQARGAMAERVNTLSPPLADGDTLIFAEAQTPAELLCAADRLEHITGRHDLSVYYLTVPGTFAAGATLERTNDRTLRLTSSSPLLFDSPLHRLARGTHRKSSVGQIKELTAFTAETTSLHPDGTTQSLTLRFSQPLTSPTVRFVPAPTSDPLSTE